MQSVVRRAANWAGSHKLLAAGITAAAVPTLLFAGALFWLIFLFDDPFDPHLSEGAARKLVAEELCPQQPDRVLSHLTAYLDSGTYYVQFTSTSGMTLATFGVARPDKHSQPIVGPGDDRAAAFLRAYQEETIAICGSQPSPPLSP